jgi:hypothetical protein
MLHGLSDSPDNFLTEHAARICEPMIGFFLRYRLTAFGLRGLRELNAAAIYSCLKGGQH